MAEKGSTSGDSVNSSSVLRDNKTHELKLGSSFNKSAYSAFHTIRYDFKPSSLDTTKDSILEMSQGNVKVTVPHIEGTGADFIYKGPKKTVQKECVIIIDNKTGEITLERLSSTIQLKKQRLEGGSKTTSNRPHTPVDHTKQKSSSVSPPTSQSTVKRKEPTSSSQELTDKSALMPSPSLPLVTQSSPVAVEDDIMMSSDDDSSSDSSDSSSDDDRHQHRDDDQHQHREDDQRHQHRHDDQHQKKKVTHSHGVKMATDNDQRKHHKSSSSNKELMNQLCEDLQLSESGSDSD